MQGPAFMANVAPQQPSGGGSKVNQAGGWLFNSMSILSVDGWSCLGRWLRWRRLGRGAGGLSDIGLQPPDPSIRRLIGRSKPLTWTDALPFINTQDD